MCDLDADPIDVLYEGFRKARKSYRCTACLEKIEPGHRYHNISGKFDGDLETYRHCLRCWTMLTEIQIRLGVPSVDLDLDCGETWEDPPAEVAELAFATAVESQRMAK